VRGLVKKSTRQRRTVRALGLKGIRDTVTHDDTPQIRGMIDKVHNLIRIEEIDE
jgi:large subunit ribosomal protein L30